MTSTDRQLIFDKIEEIVGAFNQAQRSEVLEAIDESPDGVLALARRVAANPRVVRTAAVFLKNLASGDHRPRLDPKGKSERLPAIETAMRLYAAKIVDLERHTRDAWTDAQRVELAIDYAIGETPRISLALPADQTILDVEAELRRRINAANTRPPETEEQARERRQLEVRGWKLVNACMHDEKIRAMFVALRDQCADPDDPTDDEARNVRLALLEEIAANGVQPRPGFEPPSSEGLVPIGQALGVNHDDDADLPW